MLCVVFCTVLRILCCVTCCVLLFRVVCCVECCVFCVVLSSSSKFTTWALGS